MDREVKQIEKEILACVGGKDALNRMKIKYAEEPISESEESESDDDSIDLTRLRRY